ncbi:tripartite tricarboxylate transporter substrate binding protein [Roseomonas sp. OT10]|uniref:Bug family tripartite tricarboxylate transporter substrate binding protein n=1 Tax=Roseomonas cutis TaxID=2897332 RepID=UPI001E30F5FA|nr:tripartite tricarboxylate transporter substrate binding protein [Roseomonas sp. OT10]UFN49539.1 tripartite tricarboxylate transporter substrate binding protein [Roseomonas sp. OT10]
MPHPVPRRPLLGAALTLAAAPLAGRARAQEAWPNRPVRLVVPFAAGGSTDILARLVSGPLGARLGQPVVVENRGGAGGTIGADAVVKATDNHTLLMAAIGTASMNYALYKGSITFKPEDLVAVTQVARVPNIIIAAPSLPAKTLAEAMALAKGKGGLTIGSPGSGTSNHLVGELLKEAAGVELIHVPFRGAGPMLAEVIAGRVDIAVDNLPSSLPHARDGRVRGLAVTGTQRVAALPDVPTVAEAGFPSVTASAWFGLQAPARMPRPAIERVATELQAALREPELRAKLAEQGAEPVGDTPEQFEAFIREEIARWTAVIQRGKITAE